MSEKISLKEAERKAFTATYQDGLWDVLIGCISLQFAIAPLLSSSLGDFGSSAVFVPFWIIVFLVIWLIRKYVVIPKIGRVEFGQWRIRRLIRFNIAMFAVLLVMFILGILSTVNVSAVPGWVHTARFSLVILIGFSITAYFMNFTRLYIYGILFALSPIVGEWLYVTVHAPHHGFPVTFGVATGVAILVGSVKFIQFLRTPSLAAEEPFSEGTAR